MCYANICFFAEKYHLYFMYSITFIRKHVIYFDIII